MNITIKPHTSMNNKQEPQERNTAYRFDFGDYCLIEQKRYGVANEVYEYKVIGQLESNTWVDVPVQTPHKEVLHNEIVPVIRAICCGISEREVFTFRLCDVTIKSNPSPTEETKPVVSAIDILDKNKTLALIPESILDDILVSMEDFANQFKGKPSIQQISDAPKYKESDEVEKAIDAFVKQIEENWERTDEGNGFIPDWEDVNQWKCDYLNSLPSIKESWDAERLELLKWLSETLIRYENMNRSETGEATYQAYRRCWQEITDYEWDKETYLSSEKTTV